MSASTSSAVMHRVDDDPRAPGLTLAGAATIFTRRTSPRAIVGLLGVFVVARVLLGGVSLWDLGLVAAIVALHPLTEWVIHVGILHWRPRTLGPLQLDTHLSSEHRNHHTRPHDEAHWFIPLRSGLTGLVLFATVGWLVLPTIGLVVTLLIVVQLIGLTYEWTHYLCHTSYRPRGRIYRRIWRHHRLHHFKNEHYWMGVTMHLGDVLLGTRPGVKDVPTSPTCRDLHG